VRNQFEALFFNAVSGDTAHAVGLVFDANDGGAEVAQKFLLTGS